MIIIQTNTIVNCMFSALYYSMYPTSIPLMKKKPNICMYFVRSLNARSNCSGFLINPNHILTSTLHELDYAAFFRLIYFISVLRRNMSL